MKRLTSTFLALSLMTSAVPAMASTPVTSNTQQVSTTATAQAPVKPRGCLAYGAGGAVAGHFVRSGHAFLGAMAGCAYGWHKRHVWKKDMKLWKQTHPQG